MWTERNSRKSGCYASALSYNKSQLNYFVPWAFASSFPSLGEGRHGCREEAQYQEKELKGQSSESLT